MDLNTLFGPLRADNDNLRLCPVCGTAVSGRASKKFCSDACRRKDEYTRRDFAAEKASALLRSEERICEHCGGVFRGVPKDGTPLKYCSKECCGSGMMARNRRPLIPKRAVYSVLRQICSYCGSRFTARASNSRLCSAECRRLDGLVKLRQKSAANDNKPDVVCAECGKKFARAYGDKRKRFCSDTCNARAQRRKAHRADRARLRAAFVENVDPIKVFDRDSWRCKLCGVKTPRSKRGTYEPNAPELDHILPLSRGGEHSYVNTQCACRACNALKGDTPMGQTMMFG